MSSPYLTFRGYVSAGLFSIDFYYPADAPDYVDRFTEACLKDVPAFRQHQPDLELVSALFYFSRCPGCRQPVLTNRDVGKTMRCWRCGTEADTAVAKGKQLRHLLAAIEARLDLTRIGVAGRTHLVLIEPQVPEGVAVAREIAAEHGFTPVPRDAPLVTALGVAAGRPAGPNLIAMRGTAAPGAERYRGLTPPEVERLVAALRTAIGEMQSSSITLPSVAEADETLLLEGSVDEAIARTRRELKNNPLDTAARERLTGLLAAKGSTAEAIAEAERLVRTRPGQAGPLASFGLLLARDGQLAAARTALEESLRIDPIQPGQLLALAYCYQGLGLPAQAAATAARAEVLGASV